ncbi:MAG: polymer-forming cytoskeletal protein [Lachnospiraceae bacterium]|nr:polymer-forming cytoskeletal protein [Lachnospiraceae bacterium]
MGFFKDVADDNMIPEETPAAEGIDDLLGGLGSDVPAADPGLDDLLSGTGLEVPEPETQDLDVPADITAGAAEDAGLFDNLPADIDTDDEPVDEALLESLFDGSADASGDAVADIPVDEPVQEELPLMDIPETEAPAVEIPAVQPAEETVSYEEPVAADVPDDGIDQVTVITKGTTINGSIVSDCSLNVMGTINGDIECIGKLTISGTVVGNSVASDVYVNSKRLDGNIDSEGTVKIGLGTVVVGDIKAGSGVIAGAVKGELDIKGPVIIDSTAIIKGNIKAKSVQMNNGAVLEGFCSLTYADVSIDDIFE